MTEAVSGIFNTTTPAIMAHPALIEAKKFKDRQGRETGEPKHSVSIVLDTEHPDLKGLKTLAAQVARAKWSDKPMTDIKFPFADGTKLADKYIERRKAKGKDDDGKGEFQRGKVVLKTASKFRPALSVLDGKKPIDLVDDALVAKHRNKFYFGALGLYQVNFVAYDAIKEGDKDGVTCYINMVLSTGKGERLTGGASASEAFKGYVGTVSAEDPTAGGLGDLDDEIPF